MPRRSTHRRPADHAATRAVGPETAISAGAGAGHRTRSFRCGAPASHWRVAALCLVASGLQAVHMTTVRKIPQELRAAGGLWRGAGESEQPPSRWSPTVWRRQLPEYDEYLSTLPMPISRADV